MSEKETIKKINWQKIQKFSFEKMKKERKTKEKGI